VADGFVVSELAPRDIQRSVLPAHRAKLLAVGAGVLGVERLGLLLQEGGEGPFRQAGSRSRGDLLHGLEVDLQARAGLAEGATGNDFAPLGSEFTDFLELLRRDLGT